MYSLVRMSCVWTVYGLYVVVYGLYMDFIWLCANLCGLYADYICGEDHENAHLSGRRFSPRNRNSQKLSQILLKFENASQKGKSGPRTNALVGGMLFVASCSSFAVGQFKIGYVWAEKN